MGLLQPDEHRRLIALLLRMPDMDYEDGRRLLIAGLQPALRHQIRFSPAARTDLQAIINVTDGDNAQRADGSWPIIWVIENAIQIDPDSTVGHELQQLLDIANARACATTAGFQLEALVNRAAQIANADVWVDRMARSMLAVCKVETPQKSGTGFLVRPNLVMTHHHVVDSVLGNEQALRQVELRFDYRTDSQRRPLVGSAEKKYSLALDKPILSSPFEALDYALLPVDGTPGDDQVNSRFGEVKRQWLTPVKRNMQVNQPVFILQHPEGNYLGVAVDVVTKVMPNRVQYRTNTKAGSSGSPCFNDDWELVALHHAGEDRARPTFNQGIPFSALLDQAEVQTALEL